MKNRYFTNNELKLKTSYIKILIHRYSKNHILKITKNQLFKKTFRYSCLADHPLIQDKESHHQLSDLAEFESFPIQMHLVTHRRVFSNTAPFPTEQRSLNM